MEPTTMDPDSITTNQRRRIQRQSTGSLFKSVKWHIPTVYFVYLIKKTDKDEAQDVSGTQATGITMEQETVFWSKKEKWETMIIKIIHWYSLMIWSTFHSHKQKQIRPWIGEEAADHEQKIFWSMIICFANGDSSQVWSLLLRWNGRPLLSVRPNTRPGLFSF